MMRKLSVLFLIVLFSLTAVSPLMERFLPNSIQTAQAATSSCPSNQILRETLEPIPQSFNSLNPSGDSTFQISHLEDLGLGVLPLDANGSNWWPDSISASINANSNYTQWTFNIKPDLKWSNGQDVTAQDAKAWLSPDYALNPNYDFLNLHAEISNVVAINNKTLVVDLNRSDAHLPEEVSTEYFAPVVPPSDVSQGPNATLFGTDVADGPFYVSGYTSGSTSMTLLRNPYFNSPSPAACEIIVTFVEDASQMIAPLVADATDYVGTLSFSNVAALSSHSNIHISVDAGWLGTDMVYNITHYPYNMTEFRQALAYSINDSAIVQQDLFGYGVASNNAQGEVPSTFASYNPNQPMYQYNVSSAMNLLHSIGFTGGGSASTPLHYPNGTTVSVTLFTDTSKAWDPIVERTVAGYLGALGMSVSTQTLTKQNLQSDYSSNAFNIQNNLVIYSSGGPYYVVPWLDAQQGCNVMGTPGCYGWFNTPSADGQTHWEYPPGADIQYQSNLTAIDSTGNLTQEHVYLNNIQDLNAKYLPVIMLCYPDELSAYNTLHWANWPGSSELLSVSIDPNITALAALQPISSTSSSTSISITSSSSTGLTSTTSIPNSTTTPTASVVSITNSSTANSSIAGTIELIATVVVIVLVIGGIATYMMRRRSTTS